MITVVPVTIENARRFRERARPEDSVVCVLGDMIRSKYAAMILRDGEPVAAVGGTPYAPGRLNLWIFATDDLASVRFTLAKTIKKLFSECRVGSYKLRLAPTGNPAAVRFIEFVQRICPRPDYLEN